MKIDYSPRQSGRTTRMVELLTKDQRRILLTFSKEEEVRLRHLYPQVSNRIMFWEDYKNLKGNKYDFKPIVDNADYILEKVIGDWIEVATFTDERISLWEKFIN